MSKVTQLASGRVTAAEHISITYVQPVDAPSRIMIRWPGQPSVTTPDRLPAVASRGDGRHGGSHRQTGPDSGRRTLKRGKLLSCRSRSGADSALGRRLWINLSKTGISATGRLGRVSGTVGRRPSLTVRLLRGLSWRKTR